MDHAGFFVMFPLTGKWGLTKSELYFIVYCIQRKTIFGGKWWIRLRCALWQR